VFSGGQYLKDKLTSACDAFYAAKRYEIQPEGLGQQIRQEKQKLKDVRQLILSTEDSMQKYLRDINDMERATLIGGNSAYNGCSRVAILEMVVNHELDLYDKLNFLTIKGGNVFYGFAWSKHKASQLYAEISARDIVLPEL
jgi:hypothetical protein